MFKSNSTLFAHSSPVTNKLRSQVVEENGTTSLPNNGLIFSQLDVITIDGPDEAAVPEPNLPSPLKKTLNDVAREVTIPNAVSPTNVSSIYDPVLQFDQITNTTPIQLSDQSLITNKQEERIEDKSSVRTKNTTKRSLANDCNKVRDILSYIAAPASLISLAVAHTLTNGLSNAFWIASSALVLGASLQTIINRHASNVWKEKLAQLELHIGLETAIFSALNDIVFTNLVTQRLIFFTWMPLRAGMQYIQIFSNTLAQTAQTLSFNITRYWQNILKAFNRSLMLNFLGRGVLSIAACLASMYLEGALGLFFQWFGIAVASSVIGSLIHAMVPQQKYLLKISSILLYFSINPGTSAIYVLRTCLFGTIFAYNFGNIQNYFSERYEEIKKQRVRINKAASENLKLITLMNAIATKLEKYEKDHPYRLSGHILSKAAYYRVISICVLIVLMLIAMWGTSADNPNRDMLLLSNMSFVYMPFFYYLSQLAYISHVVDYVNNNIKPVNSLLRRSANYVLNKDSLILIIAYLYLFRANRNLVNEGFERSSIERALYVIPSLQNLFSTMLGIYYGAFKCDAIYLSEEKLQELILFSGGKFSCSEGEANYIRDYQKHLLSPVVAKNKQSISANDVLPIAANQLTITSMDEKDAETITVEIKKSKPNESLINIFHLRKFTFLAVPFAGFQEAVATLTDECNRNILSCNL